MYSMVLYKHQTEHTQQEQNLQQDACIVVNIVCTPWSCTNTRQNTLSRNRICNKMHASLLTLYVLHGLVQTPDRTHSAGTESATTPNRTCLTGTESATRHMHHCNIACTPWSRTEQTPDSLNRNRICNKMHAL